MKLKQKATSILLASAFVIGSGVALAPAAQASEHISSTMNGKTQIRYKFNHWFNKFCIKQQIGPDYRATVTFYGAHDYSVLQAKKYRKWACIDLVKDTTSGIWEDDTIKFCLKSEIATTPNPRPVISCGYVSI